MHSSVQRENLLLLWANMKSELPICSFFLRVLLQFGTDRKTHIIKYWSLWKVFGFGGDNTPNSLEKINRCKSSNQSMLLFHHSICIGSARKMLYLYHLLKIYLFVFKYYGSSASCCCAFFCVCLFFRNICSSKISLYSFGALKPQQEYYQYITKMLVLLPLASSHNCINTIFQIIRTQAQPYWIMKTGFLFLIWWSCSLSCQKTLLLMLEQNSGVFYVCNICKFDN